MDNFPILRSASEIARIFKEHDPHTAVKETTIKKLGREGKIASYKNGRITLYNLREVINYYGGNAESGIILEEIQMHERIHTVSI